MSDEVVLYDYWRSSAAYRVRIALHLKGVAYRTVPIDLVAAEQSAPDYRTLNPQGLVPALSIGGHLLAQSLAIIEYLDATSPGPRLIPVNPLARAGVMAKALIIIADIHPLNNLRVLHRLRSELNQDDAGVTRWYQHWILAGFAALELQAPAAGLFGGDQPDLVDLCLVPQMTNARRFDTPLDGFPRLVRIDAALREHPAFVAAAPELAKK